ncbi:MAG: hypothetical protein ACTSX0_13850 [Promethearchaeota archaeon]
MVRNVALCRNPRLEGRNVVFQRKEVHKMRFDKYQSAWIRTLE